MTKVVSEGGDVLWQPLQEADPEGKTLADYRRTEIVNIRELLKTNQIVFLAGPSRACKTEAILVASLEIPFKVEDTLASNPEKKLIVDGGIFGSSDTPEMIKNYLESEIEEFGEQGPELIIIDEYKPQMEEALVEIANKHKIVFATGGFLSNEDKRKIHVTPLEERFGQPVPVVEIGTKPLNTSQIQEMISLAISNGRDTAILQKIQEAIKGLPVHPLMLQNLIYSIRTEGLSIDTSYGGSKDMGVEDPIEAWQEAMWNALQYYGNGRVYRVRDILENPTS